MSKRSQTRSSSPQPFAPVHAVIAIAREFERVSRESPLSMTQYRLMLYLKDGPRSVSEIAAINLITKATTSGHLTALRENKWVYAEIEPLDRRVTRIVLTESGLKALAQFETSLLDCLKALVAEEDRTRVLADLTSLYTSMGAAREARDAEA